MPIRFRCAYCNQLMGIARRKAGAIVRCPTCAGQVVVPDPKRRAPLGQNPAEGAGLFERNDFDPGFQNPTQAAGPRGHGGRLDVEPFPLPDQPALERGLFLSAGKVVLLVLVVFLLLGITFLAGLLTGRSL
jgi:hypothetical protein